MITSTFYELWSTEANEYLMCIKIPNMPYHYETLASTKYLFYPLGTITKGLPPICQHHSWFTRNGKGIHLIWTKDMESFMLCMQYEPPRAHFNPGILQSRLPPYYRSWSWNILQSARRAVSNSMLRLDKASNERPVIRSTLQITQSGMLNIIYDIGAVMKMITDHGTG